jgi:hypothetical protein
VTCENINGGIYQEMFVKVSQCLFNGIIKEAGNLTYVETAHENFPKAQQIEDKFVLCITVFSVITYACM